MTPPVLPQSPRIGILGGAFDPPHVGHVRLAQTAIDQLGLERLIVVPTGHAWHKARPLTDAVHRLAMVALAFSGMQRVVVDDRETRRSGPSYTVDTLLELHRQQPQAQWWLVLGHDQAQRLTTWHRWRELLRLATISVAIRPDFSWAEGFFEAEQQAPAPFVRLHMPPTPWSSSRIRAQLQQGHLPSDGLHPDVARYIRHHQLYCAQPNRTLMESEHTPSPADAAAPPSPARAPKRDLQKLQRAVVDGLEDVKAQDVRVFNTEHLSPLFERVIVASGTSNRQTKALSASVVDKVREAGFPKPRVEGEDNGEWIIVDCGAAVVHIMQPAFRSYYNLEELWGEKPVRLKLGAPKPAAVAAPAAGKAARKPAAAQTSAQSGVQPAAAPKPARRKAAAPAAGAATPAKPRAPAKPRITQTVVVNAPPKRPASGKAAPTRRAQKPAV